MWELTGRLDWKDGVPPLNPPIGSVEVLYTEDSEHPDWKRSKPEIQCRSASVLPGEGVHLSTCPSCLLNPWSKGLKACWIITEE